MDKIISSGFVVQFKDGRYLIGKTGNKPEPYNWTVFKGGQMNGESLIETAIRELKEETGINIAQDDRLNKNISTNPIHTYSLKNKDVFLFMLVDREGVLDDFNFYCDSVFGVDNKPEISEYKKVTLYEMSKLIFPSQRSLVLVLEKMESNRFGIVCLNPNAIVTFVTKG